MAPPVNRITAPARVCFARSFPVVTRVERKPFQDVLGFMVDWANIPEMGCSPADAETYQATAPQKQTSGCGKGGGGWWGHSTSWEST